MAALLTLLTSRAPAATPRLLEAALESWTEGKADWALTQRTRTLADDGTVREERLERYDPSLPDDRRWRLLEVDGRPPTEEQRQAIEAKKNRRPRKHANKPPGELLDLPHAIAVAGDRESVTYEVALRPEAARLVQTDKLVLHVIVSRANRSVERVSAALREPMRVALGLARVTDVDFDLTFETNERGHLEAKDEPSGTARVALSKLGQRMEYEWTDFKRVDPYRPTAQAD